MQSFVEDQHETRRGRRDRPDQRLRRRGRGRAALRIARPNCDAAAAHFLEPHARQILTGRDECERLHARTLERLAHVHHPAVYLEAVAGKIIRVREQQTPRTLQPTAQRSDRVDGTCAEIGELERCGHLILLTVEHS